MLRARSILLLAGLCIAPLVAAHGDMPSFERVIDGYLVDIGYTSEQPMAGQLITFSFDLFTGTGKTLAFAPFRNIDIKISHDNELIHEETILNQAPDIPGLEYAFPHSGAYDVEVVFNGENGAIVRTSFPMMVVADEAAGTEDREHVHEESEDMIHYVLGTFLLALGAAAGVIMIKQRMQG